MYEVILLEKFTKRLISFVDGVIYSYDKDLKIQVV